MTNALRLSVPSRATRLAWLGCAAALLTACVEPGDDPEALEVAERATLAGPIVSLSTAIGEVGVAVGVRPDATATGEAHGVVYATIDEINLNQPGQPLLAALRDAVTKRRPIFLESHHWNHKKLDALARSLFGEAALEPGQSALLLAEWRGAGWVIVRDHARIGARLGVATLDELAPRWEQPAERLTPPTPVKADDLADLDERGAPPPSPDATARLGGSTTISFLVPFARAAYNDDAIAGWRRGYRAADKVVTIWARTGTATPECVVAWRGSATAGDWLGNVANQLTALGIGLHNLPYDYVDVPVVGDFYHRRYTNHADQLDQALTNLRCTTIHMTGHSLGGAMAIYTAYAWYWTEPQLFRRLGWLRAFNPARVGNQQFVNDYNARVGGDTYTALCRDGDPVQFLPLGFASQCSYNGAAASWLLPIKNHLMTYWTQCQSGTSC
jgi:hypothetical protein